MTERGHYSALLSVCGLPPSSCHMYRWSFQQVILLLSLQFKPVKSMPSCLTLRPLRDSFLRHYWILELTCKICNLPMTYLVFLSSFFSFIFLPLLFLPTLFPPPFKNYLQFGGEGRRHRGGVSGKRIPFHRGQFWAGAGCPSALGKKTQVVQYPWEGIRWSWRGRKWEQSRPVALHGESRQAHSESRLCLRKHVGWWRWSELRRGS